MKACKWVTTFASQFDTFCHTNITAVLPAKELTKEEREEAEREAARLALEAAEVPFLWTRYFILLRSTKRSYLVMVLFLGC